MNEPATHSRIRSAFRFIWPGFDVSRRCKALGAQRIDHWWTRWLVSLAALTSAGTLAATCSPVLTATWLQLAFEISSLVCTTALCAHFAWLLFFRLQCSLLEWCAIIMLLGNAEGLLVTTPGFAGMRIMWGLVPLVAAWCFYGAVKGLTWAGIMDVTTSGRRMALLVAGWLSLAAPAMLLAGVALPIGRAARGLVSRDMAAWGVPLIVVGAVGMLVRYCVERRVAHVARAVLDSAEAARNT